MHRLSKASTARGRILPWILAAGAAVVLVGCPGDNDQPEPAPDTPADVSPELLEEARQVFAVRCASCHGDTGQGDGPAAAALGDPPPQDYSDPEWQAAVTDEFIEEIIVGGGPAVGRSPNMPPHPDLGERPELVAALRAHIRELGED